MDSPLFIAQLFTQLSTCFFYQLFACLFCQISTQSTTIIALASTAQAF
jgi:hypothetical protein